MHVQQGTCLNEWNEYINEVQTVDCPPLTSTALHCTALHCTGTSSLLH
jgi:hypothetical protein